MFCDGQGLTSIYPPILYHLIPTQPTPANNWEKAEYTLD